MSQHLSQHVGIRLHGTSVPLECAMELGLLSHRCFYAPSEQDRKLCLDRLWVQSRDCVKACSDQWFPEVGRPHRRGRARARTSPHDEAELLLEGAIPFQLGQVLTMRPSCCSRARSPFQLGQVLTMRPSCCSSAVIPCGRCAAPTSVLLMPLALFKSSLRRPSGCSSAYGLHPCYKLHISMLIPPIP